MSIENYEFVIIGGGNVWFIIDKRNNIIRFNKK